MSFETLHEATSACLNEGIQEVRTKLQSAKPALTNPVAKMMWAPQRSGELVRCETDFKQLFTPIEEYLEGTKVVLGVGNEGVLDDFREESFVILRNQEDRENYRRKQEEQSKNKKIGPFTLPEESTFTGNMESEPSCWSLLRDEVTEHMGKVWNRVRRVNLRIVAGAFIVIFLVLCGLLIAGTSDETSNMYFQDQTTREIWANLGAYKGGNSARELTYVGTVHLNPGDYLGQWDPSDQESGLEESHISGYGTMAYRFGSIYEGYWKEGKKHGNGRLITTQGQVCEGKWFEDEFTWGYCRYVNSATVGRKTSYWQVESLVFGEFQAGQLNGIGVQYVSETEFAVGLWENGHLSGSALELQEDLVRWGHYEAGRLEGNGTSIEASGVQYVGEWRRGEKQGRGQEAYPSENYTGQWHRGNPTSGVFNYSGTFRSAYEMRTITLAVQNFQEGYIASKLNSLPTVESWLLLVIMDTIEGRYLGQVNSLGQRNGYGIQNYTEGSSYEGYWYKDALHGLGNLQTAEKICEGNWAQGNFTGWGSCKYESGVISSGHWKEGQLQGYGEIKDGQILFFNEFKQNMGNGIGLKMNSSFDVTVGRWTNGVLTGAAFELTAGLISWNYYENNTRQELNKLSTKMKVVRYTGSGSQVRVTYNYNNALTFLVNRDVYC